MKHIGIMGCGVIARYGHAPAIRQTPGLQLTSVYDPDAERLARFCADFPEVRGFSDIDAFFHSGIDAVTVCSPAPCHKDNVFAAARYGKHVLCEKPLAMNDTEIAEMIARMEDAGLLLATAFCYRFSPVAQQIKDLVRAGAIGELRALRLIYIWNLHGKWEYRENGDRVEAAYRTGRMLEGGPMVDCGVHQIDLARWWTGSEVIDYHADAAWIDRDYEAPDHVWLHMDHDNGVHSSIEMSFSYCHTAREPINHFSYHLIGTDGIIRYDRDGWHLEMRTPYETRYLHGSEEKSFDGMYFRWGMALSSGELGDLPDGRQGLAVTRIARTATEEAILRRRTLMARMTREPRK